MHRLGPALRRLWQQQLLLSERRLAAYDVSGQDALAAARGLRWHGDRLTGDLLPLDSRDDAGR